MRAPTVYRSTTTGLPGWTLSLGPTSYAAMVIAFRQFFGMPLVLFRHSVRPHDQMVKDADAGRDAEYGQAGIFGDPLPCIDQGTDPRLLRQTGIEFRLVRMVQHIHHVGAADTRRIVETSI